MPKPRKLRPYAVRLEWASTISYCDVAVMATSPADAVQRAYEEVDYDKQDNYDDGGETYASAVARFRTPEQAEEACDNADVWDRYSGHGIPLKDESPEIQSAKLWDALDHMRAALARCHASMSEAAKQLTGDMQAKIENDARFAQYLVTQGPR